MRELISTFIDLNEDQSLQDLDSGNSRVFADTMTFTTTLSGSVAPHVEIAPVGSKWGLASPTSFSAFGQRIDKHMGDHRPVDGGPEGGGRSGDGSGARCRIGAA